MSTHCDVAVAMSLAAADYNQDDDRVTVGEDAVESNRAVRESKTLAWSVCLDLNR